MSKIVWDKIGERLYEVGCDHGVLYPMQAGGTYGNGVAWNGLTSQKCISINNFCYRSISSLGISL